MKYCSDSENQEIKRCVWSPKEDQALQEATKKYKGECWNLVAKYVQEISGSQKLLKSAKQCRERWNNQLNPNVELSPLTNTEVRKVFELHAKFGNSWSKISKRMQGRTDNTVKNYFLCRLRRLARNIKRRDVEQTSPENEEDLLHTLYLLDYLYKFYISNERQENIRKSLNTQTRKRKNDGDRYINKVVSNDEAIIEKLNTFTKELTSSINFHIDQNKLKNYKYLMNLKTNNNTGSLSLHNEEIRNESLSFTSSNFLTLTEQARIELPLPKFEKGRNEWEDFKPIFSFAAYSLPSLSGLYQKGLIEENLMPYVDLA